MARWSENTRCNICNKVSHAEIASDYGEWTNKSFHPDPTGSGFLCGECFNGYTDGLEGFEEDFIWPSGEVFQ